MKRRTLLKRTGIAGLGAAAITTGSVSASDVPDGMRRVEIDEETYLVRETVTLDEMDRTAGDPCSCENCDPRYCDWCGPCREI